MPDELDPKVWWLLIGTNDLGVDICSADAITAGNIRIVEEIRHKHPTTPIVINSLLPRDTTELRRHNPYWPVMATINHRLKCWSETQFNVHFFNATDIFVYKEEFEVDDGVTVADYYINETLMHDYLHPSGEGALLWGKAIVREINKLVGGR